MQARALQNADNMICSHRMEDEQLIDRNYRGVWWGTLAGGLPLVAIAYFFDVKWVVAYGFLFAIFALVAMDARLTDIVIQLRHITQLLERQNSN